MTTAELAYRASRDELTNATNLWCVNYASPLRGDEIRERLPKHVDLEIWSSGRYRLLEACRSYDRSKDAQFSPLPNSEFTAQFWTVLRKLDWGSRTLRRKGERSPVDHQARIAVGKASRRRRDSGRHADGLDELHEMQTQLDGLHLVGQLTNSSHDHAESFDLIESAPSTGMDNPLTFAAGPKGRSSLLSGISDVGKKSS